MQKFVSTTIRSTALLFPDLIGGWEGPAQFVADFIAYEKLTDAVELPPRLMSPDALLYKRKGNSFEMATLLCSLLNGSAFQAMVVSGYATREVCDHYMERVNCPFVPSCAEDDAEEYADDQENAQTAQPLKRNRYELRDPIDMRSKFEIEMAEREEREHQREHERQRAEEQCERERMEQLEPDEYRGWRVHAWVVVIPKSKTGIHDDAVFFIEPSTGRRMETNDPAYLGIESVWNEFNYHVNLQEPLADIAAMEFDFYNGDRWLTLLVEELSATRIEAPANDNEAAFTEVHKHLDMPLSWVSKLHVTNTAYEEKFPGGHKSIRYKRIIYDRFQNYYNTDGLMKRLTIYKTLDYEDEVMQWQWYENRCDLLHLIRIDFATKITRQYFEKGRPDNLKRCRCPDDLQQPIVYYFYWASRIDALRRLEIHSTYICEYFGQRDDKLFSREYRLAETVDNEARRNLLRVREKFHRNTAKDAKYDIAMRTFDFATSFIHMQFHYGQDEITPTIRIFKRPPDPEYGREIVYNDEDAETHRYNKPEHLTKVEQYLLLLQQLRAENNCKADYWQRCYFIKTIEQTRVDEMSTPTLKFSIFDALRNSAARSLRLSRQEQLERRREMALRADPDFLAPYLVRYSKSKLNVAQSLEMKAACLEDLRSEYVHMLNELQLAYEEQAAEEESLGRFLNKYQKQFDDFEHETLVKHGERLESSKRVLQHRMETVAGEFQEKMDRVHSAIMNDARLTFGGSDEVEEY